MPNEVVVDVVVRERGGKKVLKDTGDEAKKTGTAFGQMGKDAKTLQKQLFDMDIQLRKTAQEMERTGDTSLVKSIRKQQRELAALVKARKDVLGISFGGKDDDSGVGGAAVHSGASFGTKFIDSASKAATRGDAKWIAAIVGVAAAAGPFLGAALASAVVGTVGLGGIAGGIAMASRDERVKQAGRDFGATFMAEFGRANESFIGPTIGALGQFEDAAIDIAGKLTPEFEGLADHVEPLAHALVMMVESTLPGLKKGFQAADAVLGSLERALPELGEDFSDMFAAMAEDPEALAAAMHDLLMIIGETAKGIGGLTHFLSSYYEVLIKVGEVTTGWANDMPDWVRAITPLSAVADYFDQAEAAMKAAAERAPHLESHFEDMGETAEETAQKMRDLQKAIDDVFDPQMDLERATLRYEQGLIALKDELTDGKRTLDIHTKAGQDNRDAILDQIQAIKDLRDATATVPEKVDDANAAYDRQLEALRKTLLALGYNKDAVNAIIDAWKNVPTEKTTEYRYPGLLEALAQARELAALLGSGSAAARARAGDTSGYGGGRASGGYVAPGMTVDVAERGTGVERVKMLHGGGAIVQNADQWAAAGGFSGGWSGGSVGGAQTIVLEVRGVGGELEDLLTQIIRRTVTVVGGGSVQKTYGRDSR